MKLQYAQGDPRRGRLSPEGFCSIVVVPLPQLAGGMRYGILQNRSTVLLNVALETLTAGKLLYVNIKEVRSGEKRNTY